MNKVKVSKDDLLKILIENRQKHLDQYNENCTEYKLAAIRKLNSIIEKCQHYVDKINNENYIKDVNIDYWNLQPPKSYLSNYDQAISMLRMSVDNEVVISNQEYSHYVLDNWSWTENFKNDTMMYKMFNSSH